MDLRYILCLIYIGCAQHSLQKLDGEDVYSYVEENKTYKLLKKVLSNKRKNVVTTKKLFSLSSKKLPLEKAILVSQKGKLIGEKEHYNFLFPKISQYTTWLDGKKFFTQLKIRENELSFIILENKKKKKIKHKLKNLRGLCFFDQLVECIKFSNFLFESRKRRSGQMRLNLVINSYPFFHLQYKYMPNTPVISSVLNYDKLKDNGHISYSLEISGQTIVLEFDKNNNLVKKYWVVQGVKQEKIFILLNISYLDMYRNFFYAQITSRKSS